MTENFPVILKNELSHWSRSAKDMPVFLFEALVCNKKVLGAQETKTKKQASKQANYRLKK